MSESIEEKQKYLCDNVLQKGYDGEEFAQFCQKYKGSIDLEAWSHAQLVEIVSKFTQSKQSAEQNKHQASFIDYQQQQVGPTVNSHQVSPPHQNRHEVEVPASKLKRKDSSQQKQHNQPKQDVSVVEEMFKDPFSKNKPSASSSWGANAWSTAKQGTSNTKQFNFMDLLGPSVPTTASPVKPPAYNQPQINTSPSYNDYQLKQPSRSPAEVMKPVQPTTKPQPKPVEPFQPIKIQSKAVNDPFNIYTATSSTKLGNNPSKPAGNLDIFNMTIDQITQQSPSKSIPTGSYVGSWEPTLNRPMAQSQVNTLPNRGMGLSNSTVQLHSKQTNSVRSTSQSRTKTKQDGPKIVQEELYDIVPCGKSNLRTLFNTPNVQVIITGSERVTKNIFVTDYVVYHLQVKGLNTNVKRKYDHFVRLRNMLIKFYPGFRVPYLEKNSWLSEKDQQFVKRQKIYLEFFMNDILMNPQFKNSRIVEQFLTLEYKHLKAKLAEYDKLARLKSLEDLCVMGGQVNIAYSDQHRQYAESLGHLTSSMCHNLDKYKKLQEQLSHNYSSLLKTYSQISDLLATMEASCKSFNAGVSFCEFYELEQTINTLNQMYHQMCNSTKFDLKVLQSQFKPIFKFQRQNIATLKQLLDIRNKITEAYVKSPIRSNQQYVGNSKLASGKTGVEQPSKHPTVLRYQTGYFNAQTAIEAMRMFKDLSVKLNLKFMSIATEYQGKKVEESRFWASKRTL